MPNGQVGQPWSGCIVVDENNTSGLQVGNEKVMIALYTNTIQPGDLQMQNLAYSTDRGLTWINYDNNPVVPNSGIKDFRDPKVFWSSEYKKWIMVLAADNHIKFYQSHNLLNWEHMSDFGFDEGTHEGVWECPDFFELPVDGDSENKKWVLTVSVGISGMQYFVGSFDGKIFVNDNDKEDVLWVDYGEDFYAAITWDNIPREDGRRLWVGWMNNWEYADSIPTMPFQGQMSIVREIQLKYTQVGIRMIQSPIIELENIRKELFSCQEELVEPNTNILENITCDNFEIVAEFYVDNDIVSEEFGFFVRKGKDEYTQVGYKVNSSEIFMNRSSSGVILHPRFRKLDQVKILPQNNIIKMHLFIDRSSVELFTNNGELVISN